MPGRGEVHHLLREEKKGVRLKLDVAHGHWSSCMLYRSSLSLTRSSLGCQQRQPSNSNETLLLAEVSTEGHYQVVFEFAFVPNFGAMPFYFDKSEKGPIYFLHFVRG